MCVLAAASLLLWPHASANDASMSHFCCALDKVLGFLREDIGTMKFFVAPD